MIFRDNIRAQKSTRNGRTRISSFRNLEILGQRRSQYVKRETTVNKSIMKYEGRHLARCNIRMLLLPLVSATPDCRSSYAMGQFYTLKRVQAESLRD